MKSVLISGGAGFIGTYTALNLVKRGIAVTVLDNFLPKIHGDDWQESTTLATLREHNVHIVRGDVRDASAWDEVLPEQDAVLHLAAETGTGQSMYEIAQYTDVNIQGTAVLLDRMVNSRQAVKRLVVASSRSIYGEGKYVCVEHGVIYPEARQVQDLRRGDFAVKCPNCGANVNAVATDEASAIKPASVYAITKATQEQMVLLAGRTLGIPATALRYQNVYGPGQSLRNPYTGILSVFSGVLFDGGEINIFEDGAESRDFIFVEDVAEVNARALVSENPGADIVNVGTGVGVPVQEVALELMNAYGLRGRTRISGDFRLGDIRHNFAQLDVMRRCFSFTPKYSFAEGVLQFAQWVLTQRDSLAGGTKRYEVSLQELRDRKLFG